MQYTNISWCDITSRFWRNVEKGDSCWLWAAGRFSDGMRYGQFRVGRKKWKAHRVAWVITNGKIPDGLRVCHHCDNPICVRPGHLFLGTDYENAIDRTRKGRTRNGSREHAYLWRHERNPAAKITLEDAREIRLLRTSGMSFTAIGEAYGISKSQARNIITGVSWKEE